MNRIKTILILTNGILAGICLCLLFRSCGSNGAALNNSNKKIIQQLKKEAEQSEKTFNAKIDSLTSHSAELNKNLQSMKILLQQAKKTSGSQQQKVTGHIKKLSAPVDTTGYFSECDSLKNETAVLISETGRKDSLYEAAIMNQHLQIANKDSSLLLRLQQYAELKNYFSQSITQQQLLRTENALLHKKLRRQKVKNKLLTGLTVIAAGVTTHFLLKN